MAGSSGGRNRRKPALRKPLTIADRRRTRNVSDGRPDSALSSVHPEPADHPIPLERHEPEIRASRLVVAVGRPAPGVALSGDSQTRSPAWRVRPARRCKRRRAADRDGRQVRAPAGPWASPRPESQRSSDAIRSARILLPKRCGEGSSRSRRAASARSPRPSLAAARLTRAASAHTPSGLASSVILPR